MKKLIAFLTFLLVYNLCSAQTKVIIQSGTSGGTGNPNTKIGSGYWQVDGSTNQVKTLFCVGCTIDSTTNANALTITASSSYSVTTAVNSANYTVPTGRRIFVYLSDLTGQADRNVVLPAATTGDEFVFVNLNTDASGFFWTFTVGTVKDKDQSTITTLANLATYNTIYGGANFQIH